MAKGVKPRIKVPKQASAGEAITIKTLISHKMETGLRKDADGKTIYIAENLKVGLFKS